MSLNVAQLAAHIDPRPQALWADEEAKRRMVTCAAILANHADAPRPRAGEVVILEPDSVEPVGISAFLEALPLSHISALLVPASVAAAPDRKRLSALAREHHIAVAILGEGTDLIALANALNRSLLPAQMDIAHLRVRGANTLQEAADTLARLIGDSVTIETPQDKLLVFSALELAHQVDRIREETILYRKGNPDVRRWMDKNGYTTTLLRSDEPIRIPPIPELGWTGRVAMRIALEGEVLGIIWLANADRPVTARSAEILREASEVIATILLRERSVVQRDAELRAEFVDDIIRGRITQPENLRAVARSLGWNIDRLQQALAVIVDDLEAFRRKQAEQSGRRGFPLRERLTELIRLEAMAVDADALIASQREGALVFIDPGTNDPAARKATSLALAKNIVRRVAEQDIGVAVTVGIGRDFPGVDELAESYRQAITAARVGSTRLGGNQALHFDELGIHRILHVLQEHDDQIPDALSALVDYDHRRNADLVKTLKVYFDTMGRPSAAAEILHLHRNSLDYRIKRIEEIVGSSLDDPDTRLTLELGIRLLELRESTRP